MEAKEASLAAPASAGRTRVPRLPPLPGRLPGARGRPPRSPQGRADASPADQAGEGGRSSPGQTFPTRFACDLLQLSDDNDFQSLCSGVDLKSCPGGGRPMD